MIEVRELEVAFDGRVVARVESLDLNAGEIVGLAGESGSGKSMTALAILGLTRSLGADVRGSITLDGEELLGLGDAEWRALRGRRIAMVMQSPRGSLNPTLKLGKYFERTLALHGVEGTEADARIRTALADVSLDEVLLGRYPHQVSGGQAQRFAIALAVALRAEVLLADEPTSALDVTVQAQVVELLARLREEHGTAMLFISHDLAVIGRLADRVVVMRDGAVVEQGPAQQVLTAPEADYTKALIDAVPVIGRGRLA
ncbi:ABC transporter ATP-binding protein [Conexibacter woesei]|uniref:ABC transporter ATP-binding protein n=1 Tax=Conexibacter woesei TaxID=191495 RepID=UPI000416E416|nr:ABC transporter ATP-binding protein [Conexibacter woesei]